MVKNSCNLDIKLDTSEYVKNLIEKKYGFKVKKLQKIKNVYKLYDFNKNIYALKIVKYEYKHFNFIYSVMKYLQNNGFNNIPPFLKTIEGREYIEFDDRYIQGIKKEYKEQLKNRFAYLNPWIIGGECNYSVMTDIEKATQQLSELHLKSRGFTINSNMEPRNYVGKWIENFKTRRNEILDFKRRINEKYKKSEFDIEYESIMYRELQLATNSIQGLEKNGYIDYMKDYGRLKEFCHHDYANHNILIGSDGLFIIDFDYCILDTHLHDLASLLIRVMKDGNWSINTAKHIIDVYSQKIKITPMEIHLMADFIGFPQAYWQLGIQYYWEKRRWSEENFIKKLSKISTDSTFREQFVKELREG